MPELHRLPITGPNQERAGDTARSIMDAIQASPEADFPAEIEAAWRAARGNSRWIVAGRSRPELVTALAEFILDGRCLASGQHLTGPRRVTFVFSGMGPQWAGMGRRLSDALPGFGHRLAQVDKLLTEHYGRSVWGDLADHEDDEQLPTALAQPGNFLIQAALHDFLDAEGIRPDAVVGHSAGEVAAAYAAGVYDLAEAARVAVVRGRLQARLAGRGAMLAVGLGQAEAADAIADLPGVSLAAVNDHQAVTVAGDQAEILMLEERMRARQVFAKTLRVEVPYHSPVMDEIAAELEAEMAFLQPKRAELSFYSTVSGDRSTGDEWGASYWPANVRQPVRFADAIEAALADGTTTFVEIAPHPVLSQSIASLAPRDEGITIVPLLSRRDDEYSVYQEAMGKLALEGIGRPPRTRSAPVPRPTRQPQRLWDQDRWYEDDRKAASAVDEVPLLGRRVADHADEYEVELSTGDLGWVEGHQVQGLGPVVPATMWAELMALAATGGDDRSVSLLDLTIVQGLPVLANPTRVRMELSGGTVRCSSRAVGDTSGWTLNAVATVGPPVPAPPTIAPDLGGLPGPALDLDALYSLFRLKGLQYSGPFHNLGNVRLAGGSWTYPANSDPLVAWGTIAGGPEYRAGLRAPWVLDAGLQLLIVAARDLGEAMYLPFRLGRVVLHQPMPGGVDYHARAEVTSRTDHELVGTIHIFDDEGAAVAELADVVCVRNQSDDASRAHQLGRNTYALRPVTPIEVIERFTADDDDLDGLDADGVDLDGADQIGGGSVSPFGLETVGDTDSAAEIGGDVAELQRDQVWLAPGPPSGLEDDRPVIELNSVERGTRAHLLWAVPDRSRSEDAVTTFELVNQVAALDDPNLTLTLIGSSDQAWLLGLRRSATNAFGFPVRAVLIDAPRSEVDGDEFDHWIETSDEYEVHIGPSTRLSRLESVSTDEVTLVPTSDLDADATLAYDLSSPTRLSATIETVPTPGPGEITIENQAVPLTWKDVGKVFGTIGADAVGTFAGGDLGLGAVGRVIAAGPGSSFEPGDLVAGAVRRPFRRRLTIEPDAEHLRKLSDEVDPVDQLTLMMPWVTTLAALDDVGRVRPGDTVFIQSGAGALGSVLCRHALAAGCRVVTSVGTEAKAAAIEHEHEQPLDILVARGDEIPGALLTTGYGPFDCIVATVNGEARALLLDQLRVGGRYLDLGKASGPDEFQQAGALDGNRSLARIDTDQIAASDPVWFDQLIDRALAKVVDTANHTPITRYPLAELANAIGDLARGDTVGSLVVELGDEVPVERAARKHPSIDPDGIYLITGGYGGVGLMCAQWLVSRGAGTVVVTGRSGQASERGQASIDLLTAFGADIWVIAADVADRESTENLLAELRRDGPIRGIIHAAGVIADGPFDEIEPDRVHRSFGPKLDGADHLVAAIDAIDGAWDELDFMLLTSSMSGALGVSLQGTYAAANTGLDGLATAMRERGVRATAMQLGPIEEGGMAADDERNARFFAANGLSMVSPRQLFGILDLAATGNDPVLMTAEIDWQRVGRSEPGNAKSSVIGHLVAAATGASDQAGLEQLLALDRDDRTEVLTLTLLGLFTEALGIDDDSLAADTSFADMGIDSLAVVEIQVGISEILQHEVPMARLFLPDGNIGQLAGRMSEYLDEVVLDDDSETGDDAERHEEAA